MGEEELANFKIKYEGPFDASTFYQSIYDFFDSNGFNFTENSFKYKDNGGKVSLETEIEFSKKYEEDIKVEGKVELKVEDVEDVTVKKGDLIKTLQRGKVEVKVKAKYIDEYGEKIEDKLQKFLIKVYKDTFGKQHFKAIKKAAERDMKELILLIKKQLNLNKYIV